ncbi:chemotaxis-specific protein-glutamate methyltransferase CheB [Halobellus captivus]|uniref:chemotaxis-specific protein-glutamate methyltransferase CheB n=1 Tax=Halobellus captivus TaxID=2592614 RepID=UPI00119E2F51|nr:chemotaxis-specific protein-glutamate methyltransferase CheB [Halobellus captivus]
MSAASESRDGDGSTRAVIVDDSRFMRTLIRRLLEDGGVEVVGEGKNGAEAVERVREHDPDVVTMDIEMPTMNGLEAVAAIMRKHPTPVLMLSAHAEEDADVTFDALDRGAVDFVTKPGGEVTSSMPRVRAELVEKVRSAARVDLSANARAAADRSSASPTARSGSATGTEADGRASSSTVSTSAESGGAATTGGGSAGASPGNSVSTAASTPEDATPTARYPDVGTLVVGASTGGPNVVERVLSDLPRAANLRVLVVQHMPEGFTARFADRLDDRSAYAVREAQSGERIEPGEARVAPGGKHLVVTSDRNGRLSLDLTETEQIHGVRPAIDLTMASAVETVKGAFCGVLLTGMGRDGVDGMRRIGRNGGYTVAQDESTSAIFGMPRRAIETGCVDAVAPAEEVATSALQYFEEE